MEKEKRKEITSEVIETFLNGHDPQERIVNLEYSYKDDFIKLYYRNENDDKCVSEEPFYPFLWATKDACLRLCNGNRKEVKKLLDEYGIAIKPLRVEDNDGNVCEEMDNGYKFMFYALNPMSYSKFLEFFKRAKNPVYSRKKDDENTESFTYVPRSKSEERQYMCATPQEQYLISTGKRFFKGYDDYDMTLRMIFDLETTGLDTRKDRIKQFGIRFNRPVKYPRSNEYFNFEKIISVTGDTKEELDASELACIEEAIKIIYTFRPDVITAHNGENFDWNMIINACNRLGTSIETVSSKYFNGESIHKNERESILKLGGEIETFNQTIVPGVIVTDSLHAVRRAQATNSNFLQANLKYSTKFLNLSKENRVYTPGDKISEILADTEEHYAFNDKNGDWYLYDPKAPDQVKYKAEKTLQDFIDEYNSKTCTDEKNLDASLYEYYLDELREKIVDWHYDNDTPDVTDNEIESLKEEFTFKDYIMEISRKSREGGKLEAVLKEPDWEEILTPYFYKDYENFLRERASESLSEEFMDLYEFSEDDITDDELNEWKKKYTYKDFLIKNIKKPEDEYAEYLAEIEEKNKMKPGKDGDKPFIMYTRNFIADGYELVSGKYIVERYLLDDLWECDKVEKNLNGADFMLCKFIPVTFQKCCTMGTASQWKAIMMAWSYENDLAIPMAENTGSFTGGLSRLLSVGYKEDVAKFDYNSLYPSIILTWAISDKTDLMGAMLHMLEYVLTTREKYKGLKKSADKICEGFKERIANGEVLTQEEQKEYDAAYQQFQINDNLQMVVKKLGNSFFGSYGSNNGAVFPWKSVDCAERTTCTGRQSLRLMIKKFHDLGYEPIVGDTDGFDFGLPKGVPYRYTDENPYISPGLSRETKKGASYTGFKADIAEFNDLYMSEKHYAPNAVNKMGLGIDEVLDSSINFSRKNYACYFPENPYPTDVKLVGNTIKSKKMPEYIERFLDKGVRLLLQKKGQEFLNEYYAYIDKIYNFRIPAKQIASKGKIKKSLAEYVEDCKTITKAGRPKSRQAWMELALRDGIDVNLGETLYYINTGTKKSDSDVKKVTHYYVIDENDLFGEKRIDCKVKLDKEFKLYKQECAINDVDYVMNLNEYVKKNHPEVKIEEEIILNCILLSEDKINSENDSFSDDDPEYNVIKYIDQFNKRITPLLVCFKPEIRNKILITNPSDRPYFTVEECELCSGFANKPGDQDTYEQLMTMDDKEIRFWLKHPEWEIPFLSECGMDWDKIKEDYFARVEREKQVGADIVRAQFNEAISKLTSADVEEFCDSGKLPSSIEKLISVDPITGNFVHKEYNDIIIGTICDILDVISTKENTDDMSYE